MNRISIVARPLLPVHKVASRQEKESQKGGKARREKCLTRMAGA